jgi:cell shape-determining protein MreC
MANGQQEQEKPMTVPEFLAGLKASIGNTSHNLYNIYNGVESAIANLFNEIQMLQKENQALKLEIEGLNKLKPVKKA